MPYPPRPPRKHQTLQAARKASNGALLPPWKPGQSGNPLGFTRSRREQLELIERAAREAAPEVIEILLDLARHSQDDRVRTMAGKTLLEFLPKPQPLPLEEPPLSSLPPELQRRRIAELLESVAQLHVPADFKVAEVIKVESSEEKSGQS